MDWCISVGYRLLLTRLDQVSYQKNKLKITNAPFRHYQTRRVTLPHNDMPKLAYMTAWLLASAMRHRRVRHGALRVPTRIPRLSQPRRLRQRASLTGFSYRQDDALTPASPWRTV